MHKLAALRLLQSCSIFNSSAGPISQGRSFKNVLFIEIQYIGVPRASKVAICWIKQQSRLTMLMLTLFSQCIAFMESLKLLETTKKAQMFKTLPWAPRRSQVVPKNFKMAGTWPQAGPNRACIASPFLRVSLPPVGPQNCSKIASRWLEDGPNGSQDGNLGLFGG